MAFIPVSLLYRKAFGTSFGVGEGFAEKKSLASALTSYDFAAGGVTFDLILDEDHNLANDVAEHPVEEGVPITDHIRNKLREGKLTGLVSNYSLFSFALENLTNRTARAYDTLKELWEKQVPVDIVTVMEVYKNVAITNIGIARDGTTGSAQNFTISFKEISIKKLAKVEGVTKINVGAMDDILSKQAAQKTVIGRQVADFFDLSLSGSFIPPI